MSNLSSMCLRACKGDNLLNLDCVTFTLRQDFILLRGGSRTAAIFKMEHFQLLTIITKYSILDVAAVQDPPLLLATEKDLFGVTIVAGLTH